MSMTVRWYGLAVVFAAGCGTTTDGGPSPPAGDVPADDMGSVAWNNGAEATSAQGLVGGAGGYQVTFANDRFFEALRFDFGVLAEGVQDLGGANGRLTFDRNYTSAQRGAYARLELTDLGDGRIQGDFEGRTCFKDTPDANCFAQRNGRFIVTNNTGEAIRSLDPTAAADGYPQIDVLARTRAEWDSNGRRVEAVSARGLAPDVGGRGYRLTFERRSWEANVSFSLFLIDIEPGVYPFEMFGSRLNYSSGRPFAYVTDIEGGGGSVEVLGRTPSVVWGTISAVVCYAQSPGANCIEFSDVRFTAAIEQ